MSFYSADVYPGTGSQVAFPVTFDFLDRDTVDVYRIVIVDGSQTKLTVIQSGTPTGDQFVWDNDQLVTVGTAPTAAQQLKIQRSTPVNEQTVQWQDGSYIVAEDLNTSEEQSLYIDQELTDWLGEITGGGAGPGDFVDLDNLGDVTITSPVNWDQLTFDATSQKWVNKTPIEITEATVGVDDLKDANLTSPADKNALRYDGTTSQWVNVPSRDVADQDAGTPAWDDAAQATAGAIARRHDNIVSSTLPPAAPYQEGKFWFQDDANKTLSVWNGTGWTAITSGGTFTTQPSIIYVDASNGNDSFDGHRIISPKLTIKAAVEQANTDTSFGDGSIILIAPGVYQETFPITITAQNLSIVGQSIRSVFVHPTTATEEETMFLCDSGTYINGMSFAGLKASGTRGAAGSVDPDPVYGLPPNQGWVARFRTGCVVRKSPYVQNCTVFSDSNIDNDNFDPNNLTGGTGGDITSSPCGGGIYVDGDAPASNSPLRSFVIDSFTNINLDGPTLLIANSGYCQAVSFFSTFAAYHCKTISGGSANLTACTTDFGRYGLIADGKSSTELISGTTSGTYNGYTGVPGAYVPGDVAITVTGLTTTWTTDQPGTTMLMEIGSELYPILSVTPVSGNSSVVSVLNPSPNNKAVNLGLNPGAVSNGTAVKFYLRSQISTSGHTFEYVGAVHGTDYRAAPWLGGIPDTTKQAVQLGGSGSNSQYNGGAVYLSSTDENGRFQVGIGGDALLVDQRTGQITLPVGAVSSSVESDLDPTLGGNLYVNGKEIRGGRSSNPVGDIVLETDSSSTILLNGFSIPGGSGGSVSPGAGTILSTADIGTAPNDIPVNGYLGKQAFVDEVGTLRPYFASGGFYSAPQTGGDIQFRYVSDTSIQLVMKGLDGTIRSTTLTLS